MKFLVAVLFAFVATTQAFVPFRPGMIPTHLSKTHQEIYKFFMDAGVAADAIADDLRKKCVVNKNQMIPQLKRVCSCLDAFSTLSYAFRPDKVTPQIKEVYKRVSEGVDKNGQTKYCQQKALLQSATEHAFCDCVARPMRP